MTEHVPLQGISKYRIGAVTYQVAAFFNERNPSLPEKIKNLLIEDVRKNTICTFAEQKDNAVK